MQRRLRWIQVDEQEQAAGADPAAPEAGQTGPAGPAPGTGPATGSGPATDAGQATDAAPAASAGRDRRGDGVREALTSRGAGWVAAAAMTGAVVGLSVAMATSSAPTVVVQQPEGAAG